MQYLDLTLPTPAENLACDEALLDSFESEGGEGLLRFWEPNEHFVVVGYANRVAAEVNTAACAGRRVPIFRRCSGGGTVLQGPGCLNYSLILRIEEGGPLAGIPSANCFIMQRNREALEQLLRSRPPAEARSPKLSDPSRVTPAAAPGLKVCGHTDLAFNGLKFSGNAQRRKKHFLLFHGTFLLNFDLSLLEALLPFPSKQPDYRNGRPHRDFLVNLHLPAGVIKECLRSAWQATTPLDRVPLETVALLARNKYAREDWNLKF